MTTPEPAAHRSRAAGAHIRFALDIVAVTGGIAFQATTLTLNAAVEASRAGEQGGG